MPTSFRSLSGTGLGGMELFLTKFEPLSHEWMQR